MATGTSASYPPPPPYYRLYKDYVQNPKSTPEPPPPIQGSYPLFGATYTTDDVLPSLEDQGVRQLYPKGPNIDFKKELRALNRELQLHILELTDVLVERPSQYARRVEDVSLIFKNLHHLLNSLRPHQARATIIHILELQIQRRRQAVKDIKRTWERFQFFLLYFHPAVVTVMLPYCISLLTTLHALALLLLQRRREDAQRLLRESLQTLDSHHLS